MQGDNYTIIDTEKWDRKEYFDEFRNKLCPLNTVTLELDITGFVRFVRENHLSFTLALTYLSVQCAQEIEAFRYRMLDGRVVLYDSLKTRFAYLAPGSRYFRTIEAPLQNTFEAYVQSAKTAMQKQKTAFPVSKGYGYIQTCPAPFLPYTSISHTITGGEDDFVPLIGWGKFSERDGKIILPYTIRTHHSFIDGADHAAFLQMLNQNLQTPFAKKKYRATEKSPGGQNSRGFAYLLSSGILTFLLSGKTVILARIGTIRC